MACARGRVLLVALVVLAGCGDRDRDLRWEVSLALGAATGEVTRVRARILDGSCGADVSVYSAVLPPGARGPSPPVLPPGRYGFEAMAANGSCAWIGRGCEEIDLPAADGERVLTVVTAMAPVPDGEACPTDGGTPPPDAGHDGGRDAGHDANLPCTVEPELCDGIDNDCDPATADGSADPTVGVPCDGDGDACFEGVGVCSVGGFLCAPGPEESVCNGADDDCDDLIDEGMGTCRVDGGDADPRPGDCIYFFYLGSTYQLCEARARWSLTSLRCRTGLCGGSDCGYRMVRLDDVGEVMAITGAAGPLSSDRLWIDLQWDGTDMRWEWSNGTAPPSIPWAVGQPDQAMGQACASLRIATGEVQAELCNYGLIHIACEHP